MMEATREESTDNHAEPHHDLTDIRDSHPQPAWYYWIFAASGFAGLIYESIWARYLKLFLGHAAYAQALVLMIFLFGLALGAALCARVSSRIGRPLLAYALIEILVALTAVYFHEIYVAVHGWMSGFVLPQIDSAQTEELIKWGTAAGLILPQSVLLGATFPLMSAGLVRLWPEQRGRLVAMLYFSNSLGAVFGVLASAFVLIPLLGLPGTITIAGFINVAAAAAVWVLGHRFNDVGAPLATDAAQSPAFGRPVPSANTRLTTLIIIVAFGTGFASLIYEIIWVRMLSLLLGASSYTFEIVLAAFILGLALGGLSVYRRADSNRGELLLFVGKVQIVMGILAIWSLFAFPLIYDILNEVLQILERDDSGYIQYNFIALGLSLLMMLPATFCAGMTLPLLTRRLIDSGGEEAIGRVYAANTFGAIAGVFIAVHLLLPQIGLQQSLLSGAFIDMLLGVTLIGFVHRARVIAAFAFSLAALLLAAFGGKINPQIIAAGVFRTQNVLPTVVFYREGKTASVTVTEQKAVLKDKTENIARSIRTNGKVDASLLVNGTADESGYTVDEMTMVLLGLLPLLYKPDAKQAMNIGFGSGLTSRTLLLSHNLERLDNVEIEPVMIEGAKMLGERTAPVFRDRRNHFIINDAKSVLARARLQYDIIVSEPSNVWVSGVAGLYTKEFYQQARRALTEDGIFVQWMHLYDSNPRLIASVIKALGEVFGDYQSYISSSGDLIFVASVQENLPDKLNAIFASDKARKFFSNYHFRSAEDTDVLLLGNKKILAPYFKSFDAPANSDYYPYLETNAPKAFFNGYYYVLGDILLLPVPVLEFLGYARSYGDILPAPHSAVMRQAIHTQQLYASRLAQDGVLQLKIQQLSARNCPVEIEKFYPQQMINQFSDDSGRDHESAAAYMLGVSDIISHLMPHSSTAQMHDIWQLLEKNGCLEALLKNNEHVAGIYTQFWKALSLRQTEKLLLLSDVLLKSKNVVDLKTNSGQIIFLAHIAASYKMGRYQEVILKVLDLPADADRTVYHATRLISANAAEKI